MDCGQKTAEPDHKGKTRVFKKEKITMVKLGKGTMTILLLAALFSGCSTVSEDSPMSLVDPAGKHFEGWLEDHGPIAASDEALCVLCHGKDLDGGISSVSCSSASYGGQGCHASGPGLHPEDWLNKNASGSTWHADAYRARFEPAGIDCETCHSPPALDDPDGGKCVICHFDVEGSRSPDGWTHGSGDHGAFAGSPEEAVCVTCHEVNNRFGNGPFCHNCHLSVSVPHADGWLDKSAPDFHAQAYSPADYSCSICHDPSQPDTPPGYVCLDCHFSEDGSQRVPAGTSYVHGERSQEHKAFSAGEAQVCINCHDINEQYGNQGGCHNCHALVEVPHTSGWMDKSAEDFHAQAYSPSSDSCSTCHDPSQPDTPPGYVCLDCHFSEDGSQRVPAGSGYTHGDTSNAHKGFTTGEAQVCINCHDTNQQNGNQDGCHNCHALVEVPHTSGWMDKPAADFHARAYSPSSDSCSTCHDPSQPDTPPGYVCLDCHFSEDGSQRVPAGSGYVHGERSQEHKAFSAGEAQVCINCHDTNQQNGNQDGCHNCHALVEVPHTSGWMDKSAADFHAQAYSPADYSCNTCHDPSQPDTPPGYVCLDCHFSEDGSQRVPAGSGYTHGDTSNAHKGFTTGEAQVCINCHDTNLGYGNMATCHNCHLLEAPHAVEYLDHNTAVPTSGAYSTQCSSCHSISPPPVTSAPVCTACHTSGNPYTNTNCTSCHGEPPGTGKHRKHDGEATCSECHQGAGSGSGLNHFYNGTVDVDITASNFSYSGGGCTGTCHNKNHNFNW